MTTRYGYESRANGRHVMCLDFWITIGRDARSQRPSVRATANQPSLARNERAVNITMELPIALWESPAIKASFVVDSPATVVTIDAGAVAQAVRQAIGMDIDIAIAVPEAE